MKFKTQKGLFDDCLKLRMEVFVDEQKFVDEVDELEDVSYHTALYDGETPIATGRMYWEETDKAYHIGRVAVAKSHRGTGCGKKVMLELERLAKELGGKHVSLSAQCQAQGFYESAGYKPVGGIYYDQHCKHIQMIKDLEHE